MGVEALKKIKESSSYFLTIFVFLALLSSSAAVPAEPPASSNSKINYTVQQKDSGLLGLSSMGSDDLSVSLKDKRNGSMAGEKVRGYSNNKKAVETIESSEGVLSSFGRELELLSSGRTDSFQELLYKFSPGPKEYSYIAVESENLREIDFYTKTSKNVTDPRGTYQKSSRTELDYEKVAETSNFTASWTEGDLEEVKSQVSNSNIEKLSSKVIPTGNTTIYRVNHSENDILVEIRSSSDLKVLAVDPAGAFANYDSGFSAPYCSGVSSPCIANSSLLLSKDGMGPGEPNAPNTIDSATDGTSSTGGYESDESVENITVESLENTAFGGGDSVRVTTQVYCYGTSDQINFVYSPNASSLSWTVKDSVACPGGAGPYEISTSFQTADQGGEHAFRVINGYNMGSTATEGTGAYDDNDDVVVTFDNENPNIEFQSPENNSVINSGRLIDLNIADNYQIDSVKYNLNGNTNKTLESPYEISTSSLAEGEYNLNVYTNDTAGNLNYSQFRFEIDDTEPELKVFSPEPKNYSYSELWLNYTSSDQNIDSTIYDLNKGNKNILSGNETFNAPEGDNKVKVTANDTAGNTNSTLIEFFVDTTVPSIGLDSPMNDSEIEKGVFINFTISDNNLAQPFYSLNDKTNSTDFVGTYDLNTSNWEKGVNTVKVYANDSLNFNSKYYEFNVTVNQPPLIGLDSPDNSSYVSGDQYINFTVTDRSLDSTFYSINQNKNLSTVNSNDVKLNRNTGGEFWLKYYANDTDEAISSKRYNFSVDNTPPAIELFSPENKTYGKEEIWLNYSVSDPRLNQTFYSLNNQENSTLTGNTTFTGLEGSNNITVYSNDSLGNLNSETRYFSLDLSAPDITINSPNNQTYFQKNIEAEVTLSEEGRKCYYNLDESGNSSMVKESQDRFSAMMQDIEYGSHKVNFWCEDPYGNWNRSDSIYFSNKKPSSAYSSEFGAPYCKGGVSPCRVNESLILSVDDIGTNEPNSPNTIDSATDGTSGTYNTDESIDAVNITTFNGTAFSAGDTVQVSVRAHCWENGPTDDVINIIYANDTSNPSWEVIDSNTCQNAGFNTIKHNFTLTGSNNVSIRSLIEYNGGSTTIEQGSGYGDQDDVVIPLDNSPPEIQLNEPENRSIFNSGELLEFSIKDKLNSYDTISYVKDGGSNQTVENKVIDTSGWSEGVHSIRIYANDTAGNYNSKFYEFEIDDTSPSLQLISPESKDYKSDTVWLNYSSSDRNLEATFYSLNENSNTTLSGNKTLEVPEGENLINIYANDSAGNLRDKSLSFNVDSLNPEITLEVPPNNSDVERGSIIEYSVSDENLDTVYYRKNGEKSIDFTGSYDLNTSEWDKGINTIEFYANDSFGNKINRYYRFNITVDRPPAIKLNRPSNDSFINGFRFLNFSVTDKSLDSKWYRIEGGNKKTEFVGNGDINLSRSIEGGFNLSYSANDTEGQTTTKNYRFVVDNTKPSLNLLSPDNKTYNRTEIDLDYVVSDKNLNQTFYSLNKGSNQTLDSNITITSSEGSNILELFARDKAENLRRKQVYYTVDTTAPDITVKSPDNQTYFQSDLKLDVKLNEEGGACYYNFDNSGNSSMTQESDKNFTEQLIGLSKQQHSIKFWCSDTQDNWRSSSTIYFTISEPEEGYNSTLGAPYCSGGGSPCRIGESLIISKSSPEDDPNSNRVLNEPNSPNTLDSAVDGTEGEHEDDETVDQINITDLNASTFSSGHLIEISVKAYCYDGTSTVNIITGTGWSDPTWSVAESNSCSAGGFSTFRTNVTIPETDKFAVRALADYDATTTAINPSSPWKDLDDVAIPVDNNPPAIELSNLDNNTVISPENQISYSFNDPENNLQIVKYSKDGASNQSFEGTIQPTSWSDGVHSVKVWANDTAGNYNSRYYEFTIDGSPPEILNAEERRNGKQVSRIYTGEKYNFSTRWSDPNNITKALLETNESGIFQNSSLAPEKTYSDTEYANFTIQLGDNLNEVLGWKVYSEDQVGNVNDSGIQTVEIWEKANLKWVGKKNYKASIGENLEFTCRVRKDIDGEAVSGFPVEFWADDGSSASLIGSSTTDSTGKASVIWDSSGFSSGEYYPTCNISSNSDAQISPQNGEMNATLDLGSVNLNFKPENSKGIIKGTNLTLTDRNGESKKVEVDSEKTVSIVEGKNYTLEKEFPVNGSKNVKVTFYNFSAKGSLSPQTQLLDKGEKNLSIGLGTPSKLYAVNTSMFTFTKAQLELPVDSQPDTIVHCTNWDFKERSCKTWEYNDTQEYPSNYAGNYFKFNTTEFDAYGTGQGQPQPNVTELRIFDVTGLGSQQEMNSGTLVDSGLNKTFNVNQNEIERKYRFEFQIENLGTKDWNIQGSDQLYHDNLNSSWPVEKIWYNITAENGIRQGGTFSSGQINWDTSQGGTLPKRKKNNKGSQDTMKASYIVNISVNNIQTFEQQFNVNDTDLNSGSFDFHTLLASRPGNIDLNLLKPPQDAILTQNNTFTMNGSVKCNDGYCGDINVTPRFNLSGSADTIIPETENNPFYVLGIVEKSCGELVSNEECSITWEVNATGDLKSNHLLDINASSSIDQNNSEDNLVTIDKPLLIDLSFNNIDFGTLDPGQIDKKAENNSDKFYNVSVDEDSSTVDSLWVRNTNLTADGWGNYSIYNENVSYSLDNNLDSSEQLSDEYSKVASNLNPGANLTTYYWMDVPEGLKSDKYQGKIYFKANETS